MPSGVLGWVWPLPLLHSLSCSWTSMLGKVDGTNLFMNRQFWCISLGFFWASGGRNAALLSSLRPSQGQCWFLVVSCWIWLLLGCFCDPSMWSLPLCQTLPPLLPKRAQLSPWRAPPRRNTLRAAWMAPLTYPMASPNQTHFHPLLLLQTGTLKTWRGSVLRDSRTS